MWSKFWNWLVFSSADPNQAAATIKGALGTFATVLLQLSGIMHWHIGTEQVTATVDLVVQIAVYGLQLVAIVTMVIGFMRKIWLTWAKPA